MTAFSQIQTVLVNLLAASTYLSGETILADDGKQDHAWEEALRTRGFCIVVSPPLYFRPTHQVQSLVAGEAALMVFIDTNPETNPAGSNKDIGLAIQAALAAIKDYAPGAGDRHFSLAGEAVVLDAVRSGLYAYHLTVNKTCTFG